MLVSNCCGAENRMMADIDYKTAGICPRCKEHCDFVEEDTRDVYHALDLFGKLGEFFNPKTNQDTLNKITQKIKS